VAVTRGCKRYRRNHVKSPRSGWRTRCWTPGKRGSTVLLTGRDQEQNRRNRIGALPFSGLCQTVAISGNGELELKACWVQAESGQPDKICTDPLYLFVCARLWHQRADAGAGWELVRGLSRQNREPGLRRRFWQKPRIRSCGFGSCITGWAAPARPEEWIETRGWRGGSDDEYSLRSGNH